MLVSVLPSQRLCYVLNVTLYIKQHSTAGDKKKLCHLTFKVTGFYWHGNDSVRLRLAEEVIFVCFVEKAHFCDENFEHCWAVIVTFGQEKFSQNNNSLKILRTDMFIFSIKSLVRYFPFGIGTSWNWNYTHLHTYTTLLHLYFVIISS